MAIVTSRSIRLPSGLRGRGRGAGGDPYGVGKAAIAATPETAISTAPARRRPMTRLPRTSQKRGEGQLDQPADAPHAQ